MTIGVKIKQIKKIQNPHQKCKFKDVKVYDIEVEDAHHYIFEDGTISHNSYVPTKEMSGGSGLKYAASTIIYLSKKKEKDGTEIVGNIVRAKTHKSRLSKENKDVEIRLYYDERGLDRYYGLLELGELGGLWKNVAGRYEINGKKIYGKQILANPEEYFTEEIMQKLDEIARGEFSYGSPV
jgi:membrane-bound inhibitor of C-type lysozyme